MRHGSIVLALATLAGCAGEAAPSGAGGESTSIEIPPETGVPGGSTAGPALPTTGGAATTSDASSEATTTGDGSTTGGLLTSGEATTTSGDASTSGGAEPAAWAPKPCSTIYAQDLLPTFELEMDAEELAAMQAEWVAAKGSNVVEHAVEAFKFQDTVITTATVRLRGNPLHWHKQGKMQLQVSFNKVDEKGRFMGLKHLLLDAAAFNRSFLRDRLALAIMRDVGLAAPCANNARLVLNGAYYGLFTNLEKVDGDFLERSFEAPDGNLYKRGYIDSGWARKTNEEDPDIGDLEGLLAAKDLSALLAVMDLDQALLEWAAEAVIPDRDGTWAGGLNFYVYNDPKTGFNIIPWDLDDSFTRLTFDTDPYTYQKPPEVFHGRPWYDIATDDPVWFAKYIDAVGFVVEEGYDVAVLQERIDTWAAQIAEAVKEDPNKPFSTGDHLKMVKEKREFVAKRGAFLASWLECWRDGGTKGGDGLCVPP